DELADLPGDDHRQMRPEPPVVALVVGGAAIPHDGEHVRVVAHNMVGQFRRDGVPRHVEAADVHLSVVVADRRAGPADALHAALPQQAHVPGLDHLVGVAVEQDDVLGRDAQLAEAPDDLHYYRGAGDGPDRVGASSAFARPAADGVDLDADHVA